MKSSFCTNVFPNDRIDDALDVLRSIGYDAVEFWHPYLVETDLNALKRRLADLGLEVSQICPYFDFTESRRDFLASCDVARRYVEYASILDCRLVRVFTGHVASADATEEQYRQAVEGLRIVCDLGRESVPFFALETHPGSLMDTSRATLRLLADVDRPNLKVNLQIPLGSGDSCEDVFESARLLGRHTTHIHAHNWVGDPSRLTFLGEGDYDFRKFIRILNEEGFDGNISIEHGSHHGSKDPYLVARHEIEYLKREILAERA
jgi:3-dehydroshikimate dehydratase